MPKDSIIPISSQQLLSIYQAARDIPFGQFQEFILRSVKPLLQFSTAIWGLGINTPQGSSISSIHLHDLPTQMLTDYQGEVQRQDPAAARSAVHPGNTVSISLVEPEFAEPQKTAVRAYMRKYGFYHSLCTASFDPALGLNHFITVSRSDPATPWSESERALMEALFPHLIEAYVQARCLHLEKQGGVGQGQALLDKSFTIASVTPTFRKLMMEEWPNWTDWHLPVEVCKSWESSSQYGYFSGRRVIVSLTSDNDFIYATVRLRHAVDTLSKREHEVAQLFAQGDSNKTIAKNLKISPNTVRNQIKTIYRKLNVSSKASLATRIKK